jgi:hypothetical protein
MIEEVATEQELAFLAELRKYEGKWVAIHESEDGEVIVGSGDDAVEAIGDAKSKGFAESVLFYVRPFDRSFIS